MGGGPLELWNHRLTRILVLLSLGLQFVLFIFAGIRRRDDAPVRRLLLWLAYLMADSTAVYALGHLSFSKTVHEHRLVTFWAPFLLLHLGGPDNITTYALQDKQLWLPHLHVLVVQVLGAAYVLKKNIAGSRGGRDLLQLATFLMFGLSVVRYGERTWALKRGTLESIGVSVKKHPPALIKFLAESASTVPDPVHFQDEASEEEFLVRRAHSLFHVCKRAIADSSVFEMDAVEDHEEYTTKLMHNVELWALMEMELSLMYDVLYTKAAVVHTYFGYLLRLVSPLIAAASLLLFLLTGKYGHSRVDVTITYILLGGALFMETTSLVNALGSSWTFAFLSTTRWSWLKHTALCNGRWDKLRRLVVSLHHTVMGGSSRYKSQRWSYNMGQYNMLHFCTRPAYTPLTRPLLGTLAKIVGHNEWWNRKHYSGTVKLSVWVRRSIYDYLRRLYTKGKFNTSLVRKKWGQDPLERRGLYAEGSILRDSLGVEFQEGIIIWHIGTDLFLAKSERAKAEAAAPCVQAIRVLSNYMMFLLVDRPYMLPGQPQKRLYQRICQNLFSLRSGNHLHGGMFKNLFRLHDDPGSRSSSRAAEIEELAKNLYDEYESREFCYTALRLTHAARLAKELLKKEKDGTIVDSLELVLDVWMDILVYAGTRCSRSSHAQKLNSGGEMTTILWLMAEHLSQASI